MIIIKKKPSETKKNYMIKMEFDFKNFNHHQQQNITNQLLHCLYSFYLYLILSLSFIQNNQFGLLITTTTNWWWNNTNILNTHVTLMYLIFFVSFHFHFFFAIFFHSQSLFFFVSLFHPPFDIYRHPNNTLHKQTKNRIMMVRRCRHRLWEKDSHFFLFQKNNPEYTHRPHMNFKFSRFFF